MAVEPKDIKPQDINADEQKQSIEALCKANLSNEGSELKLEDRHFEGNELEDIAQFVAGNPQITTLSLKNCNVSDDAVKHLAKLQESQLTHLDLSYNQLTNDGLGNLDPVLPKSLKELHMMHNPLVDGVHDVINIIGHDDLEVHVHDVTVAIANLNVKTDDEVAEAALAVGDKAANSDTRWASFCSIFSCCSKNSMPAEDSGAKPEEKDAAKASEADESKEQDADATDTADKDAEAKKPVMSL